MTETVRNNRTLHIIVLKINSHCIQYFAYPLPQFLNHYHLSELSLVLKFLSYRRELRAEQFKGCFVIFDHFKVLCQADLIRSNLIVR